MKSHLPWAVAFAAVFTLVACSKNGFISSNEIDPIEGKGAGKDQGQNGSSASSNRNSTHAVGTEKTITLTVQGDATGKTPVDMVWAIDNSGSMREEAAQVRTNFRAFVSQIEESLDVKLALMSAAGDSGTAVSMPAELTAKGHVQINFQVGSYNPLALLASATCAATQTDVTLVNRIPTGQICGVSVLPSNNIEMPYEVPAINQIRGQLQSFFRSNARRVYVIVSDENSLILNETNFLKAVDPQAPNTGVTVYAFRGQSNQVFVENCRIPMPGLAYDSLAQATGGAVFDICSPDWSTQFKVLGDKVVESALQSLPLPERIGTISEISLDGKALSTSDYEINGQSILLLAHLNVKKGQTLTIRYIPAAYM